ncbi:MAG: hypothetical protein JJE39_17910 [Vicinamibacteria bacterium]|nr:hypothetical protein [Vicinamibacteria bacterium]
MNASPIACQLKALDPAERARQKILVGTARTKILKTSELEDGFALQFPSDQETVLELAEWITLERRCCAFAEFAIEWRRDDTVWVRVTGAPGAKEVLVAEMGIGGPWQTGRERPRSDRAVASGEAKIAP